MRILFLANDGEALYKFRKELIFELLKNNEVFVSLPFDKYVPMLKELGCTFMETTFERKGTNPIQDIRLIEFYKSMMKEIKPNVVITYTIKPNVYGGMACSQLHIPYIANITGLGSALENKGILQIITSTLYKLALKNANKVFFQNETNRQFMIHHSLVKEDKSILVAGSGVNTQQYEVLPYLKKDTIDFVYIGRMMFEKGFGLYLNAAKVIKEKYPNAVFHIAGAYEDDYQKEVEELVSKNIVVYHGSVINMKEEIYSKIDCTVAPTWYPEGMSNVLLESLACGRPIITTDRPGCKEVVDDKINGFVVKQKDGQDLINKIEQFINLDFNTRQQMGLNGRKKIEEVFDRNIVVKKYLEEINKCV